MVQIFGKIYQGLDLNLEFVLKVRKVEHHKVKVLINCIIFNAKLSYVVKKKTYISAPSKIALKVNLINRKRPFCTFYPFWSLDLFQSQHTIPSILRKKEKFF